MEQIVIYIIEEIANTIQCLFVLKERKPKENETIYEEHRLLFKIIIMLLFVLCVDFPEKRSILFLILF